MEDKKSAAESDVAESEETAIKKRSAFAELFVVLLGMTAILIAVVSFNQIVLSKLVQPYRMIAAVFVQWLPAIPALAFTLKKKTSANAIGLTREKPLRQIAIGVAAAVGLTLLFVALPMLIGFRDMLGQNNYNKLWQFAYLFFQNIVGTALAEEFIFRGYIVHTLRECGLSDIPVIAISSLLFGLYHIFSGSMIQVAVTAVIGALLCICRVKLKNCSLASVIVAHGLYDFMIDILTSVF